MLPDQTVPRDRTPRWRYSVSRKLNDPASRGCTEEFIAEQVNYCRWFIENAERAFNPPLLLVDTTRGTPADPARQIADWATARWTTETRTP